jgi:hypothetical protein
MTAHNDHQDQYQQLLETLMGTVRVLRPNLRSREVDTWALSYVLDVLCDIDPSAASMLRDELLERQAGAVERQRPPQLPIPDHTP